MPTTTGLATSFITFSRPGASGGGATVTDRDGKIKWAGHNLIVNSEAFDAASWTRTNILATGNWVNAIAAPNGTTTADLIRPTTASNNHHVISGSLTGGGTFTHAIFVRANGYTKFALRESAATGAYASFDTSTVSVLDSASAGAVTVSSPQITPIGGDWFLVTVKFAVPFGTGNGFGFWVLPDSYTTGDPTSTNWSGDGTKGIYVWGAHVFRSDLGGMQLNPAMPAGMQTHYPTTPRNLLGFTEDFSNAYWTKQGLNAFGSGSLANAAVAPNGLQTADFLQESTANNTKGAYREAGFTAGRYTISAYAKAAGRGFINVRIPQDSSGNNFAYAVFDLNTGVKSKDATIVGTAITSASASIAPVGGDWYRVSLTVASASAFAFGPSFDLCNTGTPSPAAGSYGGVSYTGDGTSGIYLWGAQLSDSASLDTYVPQYGAAVTSAAYYAPRLDFDSSGVPKGLLVEEARTNLLLQSNGFDTASWTKTRSSAAFVSGTAPDGSTTIAKITEDTTASESHLVQISATVVNGTTYTWTVYAKAGERTWLCLYNSNVTQGKFFNLSTGALGSNFVGAPAASSITPVGNGWYRCSISFAATGTSATLIHYLATADNTAVYNGDGTSGLYLYGAQLEAGSFPTSLIPTGSATATRAADVASVSTQAFPYSASEGTLVASGTRSGASGNNSVIAELGDGSASNIFELYSVSGGVNGALYVASGGVGSTITLNNAFPLGTASKIGGVYKANDFQAAANGTLGTPVTSGAVPTTASNLYIARYGGGSGNPWNGWIRQITYLPRRISNAELIARTA